MEEITMVRNDQERGHLGIEGSRCTPDEHRPRHRLQKAAGSREAGAARRQAVFSFFLFFLKSFARQVCHLEKRSQNN